MRAILSKLFLVATLCVTPVVANAYYDWDGAGCYQKTPSGVIIKRVENYLCPGAYYAWEGSGCYQKTPRGVIIKRVENYHCPSH